MRRSVPPLQGSGAPGANGAVWNGDQTRKEGGAGSQRQSGPGQGGRQMSTQARLAVALTALLPSISLKTRWQVEKGKRKTRKECFLLNLVRGEMATAITTVSTQIITPPPQKFWERKKQQVFSFSALTSVPAISWKQPLHIPSVWNMNTHSSNKFPSPPPLNAGQVRGRERVFMSGPSLPGSLLHKEEISVHSVYLFCVEKPRAINHEEIHSTLFHFTLLSTTLYRVSEWIFNIVPQNALVSYQTLGRYPSDNTGEFWEILSAEETALKFSHSDGM